MKRQTYPCAFKHRHGSAESAASCTSKPVGAPSGKTCSDSTRGGKEGIPGCTGRLIWRSGEYGFFQGCEYFKAHGCKGLIGAPRGVSAPSPDTTPAKTVCPECLGEDGHHNACSFYGPLARECPECKDKTDIHYNHCSQYQPKPEDETPAMPNQAANTDAANALWNLIGPAAEPLIARLAESAAKKAAAEVASQTVKIEWVTPDGAVKVSIEGGHKVLVDLVEKIRIGRRNFLLVGPGGSGKSTIARDLAKTLGVPFALLGFTEGLAESRLEGRNIPNLSTGEDRYQPTRVTECYQVASVICLDEIDRANSNMACVLNEALANGHWQTPGPEIARHAECVVIATANTYGQGGDRVYAGANQLDGAFLDRFAGGVIEVEYDRNLEKSLVSGVTNSDQILARVWAIREKVDALKLRRVFGTRVLLSIAQHVQGGWELGKAVKSHLTGWTADEISKIGEARS